MVEHEVVIAKHRYHTKIMKWVKVSAISVSGFNGVSAIYFGSKTG